MYKSFSFECECGHKFEDLVDVKQGQGTKQATAPCPKCSNTANSVFQAPGLATYSLMSRSEQKEHLKQRSEHHTEKYLK